MEDDDDDYDDDDWWFKNFILKIPFQKTTQLFQKVGVYILF